MMQLQTPPQLPPTTQTEIIQRLDAEIEQTVNSTFEQIRQKINFEKEQKKIDLEKIEAFVKKECENFTSQVTEVHQKRISELETQLLFYTSKHDILKSILKTDVSNLYSQFSSLNTQLIETQTALSLNNIDRETSQGLIASKLQSITTDLENIQKNLEIVTKFKDQLELQLKTISDTKEKANESFFNYQTLKTQTDFNTQNILELQKQNLALSQKIRDLSQNSAPSNSKATFVKYVAMAGFLALLIGTVATSTKIMAIINHVLNQTIGL